MSRLYNNRIVWFTSMQTRYGFSHLKSFLSFVTKFFFIIYRNYFEMISSKTYKMLSSNPELDLINYFFLHLIYLGISLFWWINNDWQIEHQIWLVFSHFVLWLGVLNLMTDILKFCTFQRWRLSIFFSHWTWMKIRSAFVEV